MFDGTDDTFTRRAPRNDGNVFNFRRVSATQHVTRTGRRRTAERYYLTSVVLYVRTVRRNASVKLSVSPQMIAVAPPFSGRTRTRLKMGRRETYFYENCSTPPARRPVFSMGFRGTGVYGRKSRSSVLERFRSREYLVYRRLADGTNTERIHLFRRVVFIGVRQRSIYSPQ